MKQYVMLAAFLFHGGCSLQATLYWILSSQAQVDHHIKFLTLLWILSSQAQVDHHIKFLTLQWILSSQAQVDHHKNIHCKFGVLRKF
jgi:hypothetical protein